MDTNIPAEFFEVCLGFEDSEVLRMESVNIAAFLVLIQ